MSQIVLHSLMSHFMLWMGAFLFPLSIELIKNILIIPVVTYSAIFSRKKKEPSNIPLISILVPVYHSSKTLQMCLESIVNQTYPLRQMEIFLLNNAKQDDGSRSIFNDFMKRHPNVKMWWVDTKAGKSKALNQGIFMSHGKYIINIDSDGWMDKDALLNVVTKLETSPHIACMTGVVLTDPELIVQTQNAYLRKLQQCEFYEYIESFLVGRNFQSSTNNLYTLAGAFSCFRRETIVKTSLYNFDTLGEDTHMTMQIRKRSVGKIALCENAFFYVDPIESFDKLYMQRQRWQRSVIEMAQMFKEYHTGSVVDVFRKPLMRLFILEHTLLLLRAIWVSTIAYFLIIHYPILHLFIGMGIIYMISVFNSFLYHQIALSFMPRKSPIRKYTKKWHYVMFYMSLYRFILFFVRLSGIVNSLTTEAKWYSKPLSEELNEIKSIFRISAKQ